MSNKFDKTLTECDEDAFDRIEEAIRFYKGPDLVARLERLFESGVPANGYRPDGKIKYTYLGLALNLHNDAAVDYLIRNNYKDMQEEVFVLARCVDNPVAAQALVDMGHSFVREMTEHASDFWFAAQRAKPDFLKSIAKLGADLDAPGTSDGLMVPPIVRAATSLSPQLVESLLGAGAAPDTRQAGGYSALHGAVMQGSHVRVAKLDAADNTVKFEQIVRLMTAAGADIDMVDDMGRTALHAACRLGYLEKAKILLSAGADHHLKDKDGRTPQDLAKTGKRGDVAQLLAATRARDTIMDVVAKAAAAAGASSKP